MHLHSSHGEQTAGNYLLSHADLFGFFRAQIEAVQDGHGCTGHEPPASDRAAYVTTLRELLRLANIPLLQSLRAREEAFAEGRRLSDEALEEVLAAVVGAM